MSGVMANNTSLNKASIAKEDEFYTQLLDIEAEMHHYQEQFRGKVIFCNCDDPYESNFFKYFAMNFNYLGLKKLIATCYTDSPVAGEQLSLFDVKSLNVKSTDTEHSYKIEIIEVMDENTDGAIDLTDVSKLLKNKKNALTLLNGDGDFRSPESIELLKEADIVATNPPFSLFRDYVAQLVEYDKKFIIIGNTNALTYKEIFKLIKNDKLKTGYTNFNVGMYFFVPDYWDDYHKIEDGRKMVRVSTSCWFTNLFVKKHNEFITLYKDYTPEEYPRYVNYDAIEVSKCAEIPCDYDREMGVPITFLDKYNPEQFEIIGSSRLIGKPMSEFASKGTYVAGGVRFYLPNGDGTYRRLYDRIVIKRKGAGK
jgi:hypothetical protein